MAHNGPEACQELGLIFNGIASRHRNRSIQTNVGSIELELRLGQRLNLALLDLGALKVHLTTDGIAGNFEFADAGVGNIYAANRVVLQSQMT